MNTVSLSKNFGTLTLEDFKPFGKVPSCSWGTREVAYPVGVRLAYGCHRLGLTPNQVSLTSLFVSILSSIIAAFLAPQHWIGGVVLLLGLQLGFMFDCADGVLARATKRCSDFGSILDKTFDSIAMIIIPGTLCVGARLFHVLPQGWDDLPAGWVGIVIMFYITPRISMAMITWLKDYVQAGGSKTKVDEREKTLFWRLSRCVAFFMDTPVCRFFLAVSWICGCFFPYLLCYAAFSWLALIIYLLKSRREMSGSNTKQALKPAPLV